MKRLTIQHHIGNPNICKIPELTIRPMPECEGGGWYLSKSDAKQIVSSAEFFAGNLTDNQIDEYFRAVAEYPSLPFNNRCRVSLPVYIIRRMATA